MFPVLVWNTMFEFVYNRIKLVKVFCWSVLLLSSRAVKLIHHILLKKKKAELFLFVHLFMCFFAAWYHLQTQSQKHF